MIDASCDNLFNMEWHLAVLSRVWLLATPWTVAHQPPLSMEFSRQEYWRRLPFPPPGDLPHLGIEPRPPALAGGFLTTEPPGKPNDIWLYRQNTVHRKTSLHLIYVYESTRKNLWQCLHFKNPRFSQTESHLEVWLSHQFLHNFCILLRKDSRPKE